MQYTCGLGRSYNTESGRCERDLPDCFKEAVGTGITTGVTTGPQNGLIAGTAGYLVCKGFRGLEGSSTVPRQHESSTQNRNQYDSASQFPVNDREPYYEDPDPALENEFDTWQTEEDFVPTDDIELDLTTDIDVRPS
jgi:hypothetical protein